MRGEREWNVEWLFGIIAGCSVVLALFVPSGMLSGVTNAFFLSILSCIILIIMFLMKQSKPIFFFSMIVIAIIVFQIITLFVYPVSVNAVY